MTTKNTCLVFGAGVSCSYGFPTGRQLMVQLCGELANGADIGQALTAVDIALPDIQHFRSELTASHAESVDRFVANRMEFEHIGKFAIAAALIPKENPATLTPMATERIYEYIWHRIGRDIETFNKSRLSIVTFNYDRSLEYFLLHAIKANFNLPNEACDALLKNKIPIAHVYGQLGPFGLSLPEQGKYDSRTDPIFLRMAARDIHLVRDGNTITPNIQAAQDLIEIADEVCILGFGYDKWNVRRLGLKRRNPLGPVSGTALHLTLTERSLIEQLFADTGGIRLGSVNSDAYMFLREVAEILT